MTRSQSPDPDDALIEAAFAELRSKADAPLPDNALLERVLSDAADVASARFEKMQHTANVYTRRPIKLFAGWGDIFAGAVAATAVGALGVFLGYSDPTGLIAAFATTADSVPGSLDEANLWLTQVGL